MKDLKAAALATFYVGCVGLIVAWFFFGVLWAGVLASVIAVGMLWRFFFVVFRS